jgi:hypothetical protein
VSPHRALVLASAAIVVLLQFPAAAALLLVVLKLALDLRGGTHANPYLATAEERT